MTEAGRAHRPVPIGMRVAVLAAPLAPLFGLVVAYLVYHPPRPRRPRAPLAFGLDPIELWINGSSARARLHAWRCPGDPQRVVILGHAGYTAVLFDFRNHGASFRDHHLTRFSRRFNHDLSAIVNSLPRSGLLPVPQALQAPPAQTLWQAIKVDSHAYTASVLDFLARALKPVSTPQHRAGGP